MTLQILSTAEIFAMGAVLMSKIYTDLCMKLNLPKTGVYEDNHWQ